MADWDKINEVGNVEDRRGSGAVVGGLGIVGTVLVLGLTLLGGGEVNVNQVLDTVSEIQQAQTAQQNPADLTDGYSEFAGKVLGSNNQIWVEEFANFRDQYKEPRLVLFRGSTNSGCGVATSQVGPHYCPVDETIYLDETFFDELTARLGAEGGEVAEAYVIAHEVGHHVQNLQGVFDRIDRRDNQASINVELQADCYAGLWAGDAQEQGIITRDEIGQAIDAAESVGDDRIQSKTTGQINPETWTHGSSEQRKSAFLQGFEADSSAECNFV